MTKRLSPFSREFWMNKGLSAEEADYKRNSFRPIKKEYWIEKGYSLEESILKAEQQKQNNNKKGALGSKNRPKELQYKSSKRRVEYWLDKGYSLEESKIKVSEIQSTFSLEKCIEKYGLIDGYNRWKERQNKWQNTLRSKSKSEIDYINSKKSIYRLELFDDIDHCISEMAKSGFILYKTWEEYEPVLQKLLKKNPYLRYYPIDKFVEKQMRKTQILIFDELGVDYKENLKKYINVSHTYLMEAGNKQSYKLWTDDGLLRSSYEIYFYEKFKKKYPFVKILIDKPYKNSSMRYDFKINEDCIEICPMYNVDEKYRIKMDKKQNTFGCILLKSVEDIDNYIMNFGTYNENNSSIN